METVFKYGLVRTFSPILKILFFIYCMYMCVYVDICHTCSMFKLLLQPKEGIGSLGARVTGVCKLSNIDSEKGTWVLWKNSVTHHALAPMSSGHGRW